MARPTSWTEEVQAAFIEAIGRGHYLEHAAALAGRDKGTIHNWMERGQSGEEPYVGFFVAYKEAEARCIDRALIDIECAESGKDARPWTNRAWWLERRHQKLFGRTSIEVEHTGPSAVVRIDLGIPDTATHEERLALLRGLVGR